MMAAIRYMDTDHWLRVRRCSIVPVSCIVLEASSPHFKKSLDDHLLSGVLCYGVMIWQLDRWTRGDTIHTMECRLC
jgi:hypothetical protein